jgi:hypothetical protein
VNAANNNGENDRQSADVSCETLASSFSLTNSDHKPKEAAEKNLELTPNDDGMPVMQSLDQDFANQEIGGLMMRSFNQDSGRKNLMRSPDVNSDNCHQLASVFGAEMRMATSPEEEESVSNCKVKVEQIETVDGIHLLSHATAYATL